ncbi:FtsX-like permease family protein [Synechocystis salina LEGE 06099]|uniref:ABC transporter permease DevC n=1 Tax=Synechocystis salina TaxID=945780 RepID=UPI00187E11D6|nr:ABC transporter permease DevC [Synechocystis salina]MBE9202402.1 FtsX-like permease family protein [Synechocystis salina LEGE 06099]
MFRFRQLLHTLRDRTPLGLLQLNHDRLRLLTAIAGITFADVLIFMQLGFADALYRTNTQYPRTLQTDLVMISSQAENFNELQTFSRRRLYQALDVPGVTQVDSLYLGSVKWRNPETKQKIAMLVIGQDPHQVALNLPEVNQQLEKLKLPNTVLFDQKSRGNYGQMLEQLQAGQLVTTEIGKSTVTVAGLFSLGASFADDGALITSTDTFLRLFPKREAGTVSLGLIHLEPGADPETVRATLETYLPDDVQVFTNQGYVDFEIAYIQRRSPIGFVFGLGTVMGFIVGTVIVYQVLSTDVNSHLAEYATFRAMGYRQRYLLGVIFEEALILSVLGFIPSLAIAVGAYQLTAFATALPIFMPVGRAVFVFVLTLVMCSFSGVIAARRLQAADPADIFA